MISGSGNGAAWASHRVLSAVFVNQHLNGGFPTLVLRFLDHSSSLVISLCDGFRKCGSRISFCVEQTIPLSTAYPQKSSKETKNQIKKQRSMSRLCV